ISRSISLTTSASVVRSSTHDFGRGRSSERVAPPTKRISTWSASPLVSVTSSINNRSMRFLSFIWVRGSRRGGGSQWREPSVLHARRRSQHLRRRSLLSRTLPVPQRASAACHSNPPPGHRLLSGCRDRPLGNGAALDPLHSAHAPRAGVATGQLPRGGSRVLAAQSTRLRSPEASSLQ